MKAKKFEITKAPRSMQPMFFLQSIVHMLATMREGQFAVLSAFGPGEDEQAGLLRRSELVDRVRVLGLFWFPIVCRWGEERRRSIFVHGLTLERAAELAAGAGQPVFVWGEKGAWMMYQGWPPVPLCACGELSPYEVDVDLIAFREKQTRGAETHPGDTKTPGIQTEEGH